MHNLKPFRLKKNNEELNTFSKGDDVQEHSNDDDELGIEQ